MAEDSTSDEVWRLPKGKQTPVMRKLPTPRAKKGPGNTIPLFDPADPFLETDGEKHEKPPF
jgi:hypothetical protein